MDTFGEKSRAVKSRATVPVIGDFAINRRSTANRFPRYIYTFVSLMLSVADTVRFWTGSGFGLFNQTRPDLDPT
jgi:hypothetical protein